MEEIEVLWEARGLHGAARLNSMRSFAERRLDSRKVDTLGDLSQEEELEKYRNEQEAKTKPAPRIADSIKAADGIKAAMLTLGWSPETISEYFQRRYSCESPEHTEGWVDRFLARLPADALDACLSALRDEVAQAQ